MDLAILQIIQNNIGGSITLRKGVNAYRYRLHNIIGMIKLIEIINGHIRNTIRIEQLKRVCTVLNVPIITPIILTVDSPWFAGFWDADGTIGIYFKIGIGFAPSIVISLSNKLAVNLEPMLILGGAIYFDKSQYGTHLWSVQSEADIIVVADSLKKFSRSYKGRRLHIVKDYYELKKVRAYRNDSATYSSWQAFEKFWDNKK
jgi:hypothetical protein